MEPFTAWTVRSTACSRRPRQYSFLLASSLLLSASCRLKLSIINEENDMRVENPTRPGESWRTATTLLTKTALAFAVLVPMAAGNAGAEETEKIQSLDEMTIDLPNFKAYEVEYKSGGGRFFHQVRPTRLNGAPKISVINIIDSPAGVIVDSRGIDRKTLRLEYMMSPYFAWGQEYAVAQFGESTYEWLRIPIGGGEPTRLTGQYEHSPFIDDLGFSPTFAALLPLPAGARFTAPVAQPKKDGSISSAVVTYEVIGREKLELKSGLECECWVLEQKAANGGATRFWVSREAPFVFRRHRDIGGPRDFVSDALSFRAL